MRSLIYYQIIIGSSTHVQDIMPTTGDEDLELSLRKSIKNILLKTLVPALVIIITVTVLIVAIIVAIKYKNCKGKSFSMTMFN